MDGSERERENKTSRQQKVKKKHENVYQALLKISSNLVSYESCAYNAFKILLS